MSELLNQSRGTKIYIGYLPVTTTENFLKEAFERHCPVPDIIIKKANAQGQFDKYCYGFVTLGVVEPEAQTVIDRVSEEYPNWRIKIKTENDLRMSMPRQNAPFQPSYPQPTMPMPMQHAPRFYPSNQVQNDKGKIFGEKQQRIMVRELWLGGIPEQTDHNYMANVMSQFGQVEATEIFPKFAFVKFRKAADAALAFENALKIYNIFGSNTGFRISFSDPSRRKDIVANHYELERISSYVPTLFLGFPPITSAQIEVDHMLRVCEKYGVITNYFLKETTGPQMRSYFLFSYDTIHNAKRAKQELCRRKDLLGEKRVEITLLLEEESVTAGRDFNYTVENFAIDQGGEKQRRPREHRQRSGGNIPSYSHPNQPSQQPFMGYSPQMMGAGGYGHMMPPPPYGYPPHTGYAPPNYPNMGYYYPPYQMPPQEEERVEQKNTNHEMFNLIQSMLEDPSDKPKPPQKKEDDGEDASDIISKMLGNKELEEGEEEEPEKEENNFRDREPNWSGFLTWRGNRRAGVDGYMIVGECEFSDYSINVTSLVTNDHVVMKQKSRMMVLQPTNSISQPLFEQYLKVFSYKTGVSVTKNWLIYVIGKTVLSDSIRNIKDNELLIVLEKASLSQVIKDKIEPIDDTLFE